MQATDRHRRMARTLGCLVASMTVGAAVLDWVQPTAKTHRRPAIELIARGSNVQQWTAIRVSPRHVACADEVTDAHFLVERDGNWLPTESWKTQRRLNGEPVVRIGVVVPVHSNEATSGQWLAAQELMAALQEGWSIAARHIDVDDTLAVAAPPMVSAARSHR